MTDLVLYAYIGLATITVLIHFILYALRNFDRKKKQEKIMIENAAIILNKLDKIKNQPLGGIRMDKDIKAVGNFLSKKLDNILEEMNSRFDDLEEQTESEEIEEFEEEFEEEENLPFDIEPPQPKNDQRSGLGKRQIPNETRQEEKKKGLFRIGGKK